MKKYAIFISILFFIGCSNQVVLRPDSVEKDQKVHIQLRSGKSVSGTLNKIEDEYLTVVDKNGQAWRATRTNIAQITGPAPIRDATGKLISEGEIAQNRTNSNFWLFSLSGAALSLGTSFFLSSMASRAADDDLRDPIILGGTAAGTSLGTFIFARKGARKDRQQAIAAIQQQRAPAQQSELEAETLRKKEIQDELDRIKKERANQEAEIEKMKKQIQEKNK